MHRWSSPCPAIFAPVGLDVDKVVVVEITIRHHIVRTAVVVHVRRAKPPIFLMKFGNFYPKVYHNTPVGTRDIVVAEVVVDVTIRKNRPRIVIIERVRRSLRP